jgi:hypothetical protein
MVVPSGSEIENASGSLKHHLDELRRARCRLEGAILRERETERVLNEIGSCLEAILKGGSPSTVILERLGLRHTPRPFLRRKLYALLVRAQRDREEAASRVRFLRQLVEQLELCPACSGTGLRIVQLGYEVLDGGRIVPLSRHEPCPMCGGRGKISGGTSSAA